MGKATPYIAICLVAGNASWVVISWYLFHPTNLTGIPHVIVKTAAQSMHILLSMYVHKQYIHHIHYVHYVHYVHYIHYISYIRYIQYIHYICITLHTSIPHHTIPYHECYGLLPQSSTPTGPTYVLSTVGGVQSTT